MDEIIIADTSCLIILSKIGELDILQKLYTSITTTEEIAAEFMEPLPDWVKVENVSDVVKQKMLENQIDKGEASALALAMEKVPSMVIIDDDKARKLADNLGVKFVGTIGIIIKAKQNNIVPSIKPILQKIKVTNFRMSAALETIALKLANE